MPGLRENIEARLTRELKIDEEFASLIPPLTDDEYKGLEASIIAEGCRDAIIAWGNIIVDGHNRYRICTAHNIPYRVQGKDFKNRDAVILWMLRNQLSRRNLNDFQRVEMVRKCEAAIKAQAKERQATSTGGAVPQLRENLPKVENKRATDELGTMAGVSRKTYEHAAAVLDKAPEPIIEATRKKELSIDAAYQITKLPQEQQTEVSQRIVQGEKPKEAVAAVKKQAKPEQLEQLEIAELEELIAGTREFDRAKDSSSLVEAYKHNKVAKNARLDFSTVIPDEDISVIVSSMRKYGQREFTISSSSVRLDKLSRFEAEGFKVVGLVTVNKYDEVLFLPSCVGAAPALLLKTK